MSWRTDGGAASLFDEGGRRKYTTRTERLRFLVAARSADPATAALCELLVHTGCRISEALEVSPSRLDVGTGRVIFRTLKRRRLVFRAVPIPADLIEALDRLAIGREPEEPLWLWCRQTAWRRVKTVMAACGITGAHAMPRGLRHGFGIANAEENVPPGLTRRWMGHARLETTAIYQDAVGQEEQAFAKRLWARLETTPTKDRKRRC